MSIYNDLQRPYRDATPVPQPAPTRVPKKSNRKRAIILLAIAVSLLLAILISQNAFDPNFLRPGNNEEILVFWALTFLISLLFVALTFVLFRNLLKLFAERRMGVLGSKFRTRMVAGALLLSFVPVVVMYWFAYGLMNRSIERWFSTPAEEVRSDIHAMGSMLTNYATQNARSEAQVIAASAPAQRAFTDREFSELAKQFRLHEPALQGGFALAVQDGNQAASFNAPGSWALLRSKLPLADAAAGRVSQFTWNNTDYTLGTAPVGKAGTIVVAIPLPAELAQTLKQVEAGQQRYYDLARERRRVRSVYMGYLLLLTMIVLFVTTWLALFLSKLVTRPLAALAEATQEISRGRLDYRVEISGADEIGDLVRSFNRMAEELEASRRQIEASSRDVGAANAALEGRRRYIETVLESIPTGVISIDAARRVTLANAAFSRMFYLERVQYVSPASLVNLPLREVVPAEVLADLEPLLRRADRMGITAATMELALPRAKLNVAVTVSTLSHTAEGLGYVLVFEDLSDLLRAQKQAAWREVARRVAHEIKNPLTPIALSAERIHRHLSRGTAPDAASLEIIRSCAETIGKAAETVRALVDEFSVLARFPASRPQPASLNDLVENTLVMFNGRLEGIRVRTELAQDLPAVMADPEAIKRALANLVDNAAEAMQDAIVKEITISTSLVASRDAIELSVSDTGAGVSRDVKERLFLPYFSTKQRGTGLGLAIVSRIVEDHHGSIRIEENKPVGSRFVIELPVAAETIIAPAAS